MAQPDASQRSGAILLAAPGVASSGVDLLRAPLGGHPLAAWALAALRETHAIGEIALVVAPERVDDAGALVAAAGIAAVRVVGMHGVGIAEAIRVGLDALGPSSPLVVVHEAARPLVASALITAGISAFRDAPDLVAACTASPVKETIKRVRDGVVTETLDRSRLALLATPMVCERAALEAACRAGGVGDDLASIVRVMRISGGRIATIPGGVENLVVSTLDDLALAERLLRARGHT